MSRTSAVWWKDYGAMGIDSYARVSSLSLQTIFNGPKGSY